MKTLPYLAGAAFYLVFLYREQFTLDGKIAFGLFDDAMISMTYARNLAAGHGLRWHASLPPVEGYSNFLWTLLMAVFHWVGFNDNWASFPVQLTGLGLLLTNAWYTGRSAEVLFPSRPPLKILAILGTLFFYPLVFWTLRGMEVGLIATLISAAVYYSLTYSPANRGKLGVVLALLPLVRDDAMVACFLISALTAYSVTRTSEKSRAKEFVILFLCSLVPFALHLAGRKAYYGEWLPNTYFLKMKGLPILQRVRDGLYFVYAVVVSELWPLVLPLFFLGKGWRPFLLPLSVVAGQMAYSAYVGGDAWEWMKYANRYIAVAGPALVLAFLGGVDALLSELQRPETQRRLLYFFPVGVVLALSHWLGGKPGPSPLYFSFGLALAGGLAYAFGEIRARAGVLSPSAGQFALAAAALFAIGEGPAYYHWGQDGASHGDQDARMAHLAIEIAKCTPPETRVAVTWAGAIPYFSRRIPIDILGKNDPFISRLPAQNSHVGHNKWDLAHSLGEPRPEIVVLRRWSYATPLDEAHLADWGYLTIGRQIYVQPVPQTEECLNVAWDKL